MCDQVGQIGGVAGHVEVIEHRHDASQVRFVGIATRRPPVPGVGWTEAYIGCAARNVGWGVRIWSPAQTDIERRRGDEIDLQLRIGREIWAEQRGVKRGPGVVRRVAVYIDIGPRKLQYAPGDDAGVDHIVEIGIAGRVGRTGEVKDLQRAGEPNLRMRGPGSQQKDRQDYLAQSKMSPKW